MRICPCLIPLFDLIESEIDITNTKSNISIIFNKNSFGVISKSDIKENEILKKIITSTNGEIIRNLFYSEYGMIVDKNQLSDKLRSLIIIRFSKEDFYLKNLDKDSIKENKYVKNCLKSKCPIPFDNLLISGSSEGQFIIEEERISPLLLQIAFIVNFNEETTEENWKDKMEYAARENKVVIFKSYLKYNEFLMRTKTIENSYLFFIEFYNMKKTIKLDKNEKEKSNKMLDLKREYPIKFNYLIMGYEEININLSNLESISQSIITILLDEISLLKIKY